MTWILQFKLICEKRLKISKEEGRTVGIVVQSHLATLKTMLKWPEMVSRNQNTLFYHTRIVL